MTWTHLESAKATFAIISDDEGDNNFGHYHICSAPNSETYLFNVHLVWTFTHSSQRIAKSGCSSPGCLKISFKNKDMKLPL